DVKHDDPSYYFERWDDPAGRRVLFEAVLARPSGGPCLGIRPGEGETAWDASLGARRPSSLTRPATPSAQLPCHSGRQWTPGGSRNIVLERRDNHGSDLTSRPPPPSRRAPGCWCPRWPDRSGRAIARR